MAFIRKVKTASGATAVQIAYKVGGRIVKIIHIGSAHNKEELDILLAVARKRLFVNQLELLPQVDPLQIKTKRSFLLCYGKPCKNNMRYWGLIN